jgi:hypothetical protein
MLIKVMSRSWGSAVQSGNAPFQFAVDDRPAFFEPLGWREVEFRSAWDEARRLKREMRLNWLMRLMMRLQSARQRDKLRTMNGYILFERT